MCCVCPGGGERGGSVGGPSGRDEEGLTPRSPPPPPGGGRRGSEAWGAVRCGGAGAGRRAALRARLGLAGGDLGGEDAVQEQHDGDPLERGDDAAEGEAGEEGDDGDLEVGPDDPRDGVVEVLQKGERMLCR